MKFAADSMLGRLAKWLRVLGYDTLYQSFKRPHILLQLLKEDRLLLTRQATMAAQYKNTVLLHAVHVGDQLDELRNKIYLGPERSSWFSRCLICNTLLKEAHPDEVRNSVPEYVFFDNMPGIRSCPSCGRYYWPGSHRTRMERQLEVWGFI